MKKINILLFLLFMLFVPMSIDNVLAAKSTANVKCEYKIYTPETPSRYLSTVYVYFNPENKDITKLTHTDANNKEKEFTAFDKDYDGYDSKDDYSLNYYKDIFRAYIEEYKLTKACPDIYTYRQYEGSIFYIMGVDYNVNYAGLPYSISKAQKHYISSDGKNWTENTASKQEQKEISCDYNFGTDIGLYTTKYHLNLDMNIKKITNITVYEDITSMEACGKKGYSYSWDSQKKQCYTKGEQYYNLIFTDPDSDFKKNFNKPLKLDNWPTLFGFGKSNYSSGNDMSIYITSETVQDIFKNDQCLSKKNIYSYFNPDTSYGWQINITSDYEEAKDSEENIYDGDSSFDNDKDDSNENNGDSDKPIKDVCEVLPESIKNYLMDALKLIRWVSLALMIVLGTLDFVKASASDDQDALKKAWQNFIKRLIAVIILFLLPILVEFILYIAGLAGFGECYPITDF